MAAGLAVGSSLGAAMKELANTQGGAKPADLRRISAAAGQALVGNDADRLIVSYIVVMVVMVAMRMMMMTVAVAIPRPTLCYLGDLHFHLTLHHAGGGGGQASADDDLIAAVASMFVLCAREKMTGTELG